MRLIALSLAMLITGCESQAPHPTSNSSQPSYTIGSAPQPASSRGPSPSSSCLVYADTALPASEGEVKVAVFNASDVAGMGQRAANDLTARGFAVVKVAADSMRPDSVAVVRYGPGTVGKAALLRAYFLGQAKPQFDITRNEETVDVIVGAAYRQLATPPEKNQAIAMMGLPQAPPGTCPIT